VALEPPFLLPKLGLMSKRLIDPDGRFATLVEPVAKAHGYALVKVHLTGSKYDEQILEIMLEPDTAEVLGLDDCAKISRELATIFEVEDPISGAYRLEVGSPGLDRPLTRAQDFERFKGWEAKIEMETPLATGQKRFRGVVKGLSEDESAILEIEIDGGEKQDIALPVSEIRKARLVFSEDMIDINKNKQKA
tara:strand:+ start:291 stop:866 length:576 start_codon:yes stop_codon:yes gene_type:complete